MTVVISHRSSRINRSNRRSLGPVAVHHSLLGALIWPGAHNASRDSSGIGSTTSSGISAENASAPVRLDQPSARPSAPKCVGTRSGRTATCQASTPSHSRTTPPASTRIHGAVGSGGRSRASSAADLVVVIERSPPTYSR